LSVLQNAQAYKQKSEKQRNQSLVGLTPLIKAKYKFFYPPIFSSVFCRFDIFRQKTKQKNSGSFFNHGFGICGVCSGLGPYIQGKLALVRKQ
jgi:hypothetical protein